MPPHQNTVILCWKIVIVHWFYEKKPHIFYCYYQFISCDLNIDIYEFYNVTGTPRIVQYTTHATVCRDTDEVGCWWTLSYTDGSLGVGPWIPEPI